jgi:hypothetical protein
LFPLFVPRVSIDVIILSCVQTLFHVCYLLNVLPVPVSCLQHRSSQRGMRIRVGPWCLGWWCWCNPWPPFHGYRCECYGTIVI